MDEEALPQVPWLMGGSGLPTGTCEGPRGVSKGVGNGAHCLLLLERCQCAVSDEVQREAQRAFRVRVRVRVALHPKSPHPQIRVLVSIRLRVGLALGLGFVYPLASKLRTLKSREPGRAPPRHAHGDLTSLAPHERLPEVLGVPREKTPMGAAA